MRFWIIIWLIGFLSGYIAAQPEPGKARVPACAEAE